jgi:hypothetical protein
MVNGLGLVPGGGVEPPRYQVPADFEFHSGFCTVRRIFYFTILLNVLPEWPIALI